MTLICIVCGVIAYLLGSLNTSIIFSAIVGKDVRKEGSGNAGATNTLRVFGKGAAAVVVLGDALKGVVAVLVAKLIVSLADYDSMLPVYIAGLLVVLGHNFPLYFNFKGGKGIMTSAAVIFVLDWKIGLVIFVGAIIIMALSKYVSLGSCVAAVLFPILVAIFHSDDICFIILSVVMGALALFMHRSNILRLVKGTESKLNFKK